MRLFQIARYVRTEQEVGPFFRIVEPSVFFSGQLDWTVCPQYVIQENADRWAIVEILRYFTPVTR